MIATLGRFAREQIVELAAATAAAAFLLSGRVTWDRARSAIDVDLLLLLFALLVTVDILRRSGYIDSMIAGVVRRFSSTRAFAAVAIGASGLLAALLTNDVALFAIIPVTVIASRISDFDVEDAVAYVKEHRSLEGYNKGDRITNDELLTLDVDVLLPAALENVITTKNAAERPQCFRHVTQRHL